MDYPTSIVVAWGQGCEHMKVGMVSSLHCCPCITGCARMRGRTRVCMRAVSPSHCCHLVVPAGISLHVRHARMRACKEDEDGSLNLHSKYWSCVHSSLSQVSYSFFLLSTFTNKFFILYAIFTVNILDNMSLVNAACWRQKPCLLDEERLAFINGTHNCPLIQVGIWCMTQLLSYGCKQANKRSLVNVMWAEEWRKVLTNSGNQNEVSRKTMVEKDMSTSNPPWVMGWVGNSRKYCACVVT